MYEPITINSSRGPYTVHFHPASAPLQLASTPDKFYLIDARVADLYPDKLSEVFKSKRFLLIEALEKNKSLEAMPEYIETLVARGIKKTDVLVAVGGGIIQDITCFLSSTLLRGISWEFVPTTLLSQCDSCIGSKSSINCRHVKNIIGTFNPPRSIHIFGQFLQTLSHDELRSGIGEMIKVHIIDGYHRFQEIAEIYPKIETNSEAMLQMIRASLLIKKELIEVDEFDQGIRNILNYGHSFGHALESASSYAIPHGIAVTIGMDIANWIGMKYGRLPLEKFNAFHTTLVRNYDGYQTTKIDMDRFFESLSKDKKRTSESSLNAIIPDSDGKPTKLSVCISAEFRTDIQNFLNKYGFHNLAKKDSPNEEKSQNPAQIM